MTIDTYQSTPADEKALQLMRDRVVLKPLTRWNEAYKEFPRYVMEYLCARYVDPDNPIPGQQRIDRLLQEHYVDSEARELIKSRIKERKEYVLLGSLQVRLDAARDHYWAEVPAIPGCATQGETFEELLENLYEAVEGCLSVEVEPEPTSDKGRVIEIAV